MTVQSLGRVLLAGLLVAGSGLVLGMSAPPGRRTAAGVRRFPHSALARPRWAAGSGRLSWLAVAGLVWAVLACAQRLGFGRWAGPVPVCLAAVVAAVLARRRHRQRQRNEADLMAAAVFEAVSVLAADLSVGRSPPRALTDLVDDLEAARDPTRVRLSRLLRPVAEAGALGGIGASGSASRFAHRWVRRPRTTGVRLASRGVLGGAGRPGA